MLVLNHSACGESLRAIWFSGRPCGGSAPIYLESDVSSFLLLLARILLEMTCFQQEFTKGQSLEKDRCSAPTFPLESTLLQQTCVAPSFDELTRQNHVLNVLEEQLDCRMQRLNESGVFRWILVFSSDLYFGDANYVWQATRLSEESLPIANRLGEDTVLRGIFSSQKLGSFRQMPSEQPGFRLVQMNLRFKEPI